MVRRNFRNEFLLTGISVFVTFYFFFRFDGFRESLRLLSEIIRIRILISISYLVRKKYSPLCHFGKFFPFFPNLEIPVRGNSFPSFSSRECFPNLSTSWGSGFLLIRGLSPLEIDLRTTCAPEIPYCASCVLVPFSSDWAESAPGAILRTHTPARLGLTRCAVSIGSELP